MIFAESPLKGCYNITLTPRGDSRGWFARTFCKETFLQINHHKEWVQMNHSFTAEKGTVRGMHFQHSPHAEIKMVRCIAGAVYDVAVDLRKDSETFLQWYGVELSAENKQMIYIPEGFAHGFQTLTENVELIYHHTEFYTPEAEAGLLYNDPMLNINWPLHINNLSERDTKHPIIQSNFKGI